MISKNTIGVIENLLAAMIFFSPNFLLLFSPFQNFTHIFLFYDYVIMFIIISVMSQFRYKAEMKQKRSGIDGRRN
jgi:hypothetical protein